MATKLDDVPTINVKIITLIAQKPHEHEVANKVRRGEILSYGVHRLEDKLRIAATPALLVLVDQITAIHDFSAIETKRHLWVGA